MLKGLLHSIEMWLLRKNINRILNRTDKDMFGIVQNKLDILQIIIPDYKFNRSKLRGAKLRTYYETLSDLSTDIHRLRGSIERKDYFDANHATEEEFSKRSIGFNMIRGNPIMIHQTLRHLESDLDALLVTISKAGLTEGKEQYYLRTAKPILKTIDNLLELWVGVYE